MRYLITVSSLTPGSGLTRYVFTLCRLLSQDNEVWVMTTHDSGSCAYERKELDKCGEGINLISLGKKSKIGKYMSVLKWIRKIKPDIIVNNYNGVIQYLLPYIPKSVRTVHVLHNDTDDFYRIGAINGDKTDGWIAPTESIARRFNEYTGNRFKERVKLIPHGVEECDLPNKNGRRLEVLYAGVLYEHKGVKILPSVIKTLLAKGVKLHFTIIGGGLLGDWLKEEFIQEISDGTVTMTGVIAHEKVYEEMAKADIFLYPTHLDAFGLVIAEAMMNGLVPIVTHLPGITDNLITDEMDGYLVPQDDIETFVSRIKYLYDQHARLRLMQGIANNKAKEHLSMTRMKGNYLAYFSSL